jgi:hypothetical protein
LKDLEDGEDRIRVQISLFTTQDNLSSMKFTLQSFKILFTVIGVWLITKGLDLNVHRIVQLVIEFKITVLQGLSLLTLKRAAFSHA